MTDPAADGNPGDAAASASEQLTELSHAGIERGRDAAAGGAEAVAGAADDIAERLAPQSESLARYAERLSSAASGLAERLRTRSLDELVSEAQASAREHPALVIAGSLVAGFALARFLKASALRPRPPAVAAHRDEALDAGDDPVGTSASIDTPERDPSSAG